MDTNDVKSALDAFEQDDFITAKDILQKQMHQAKNDFLKAKLELKGDIEDQFVELKPPEEPEPEKPAKKQRILARKKAGGE